MLQVLVAISHKFCCKKEACGYAKVIQKRERERERNRQVSKNRKRGAKATRLKKKERRKE
jgi:hypothetical protein